MHKPDPVDVVAIAIPVLLEVVSVSIFICFIALVVALWCGA